MRNFEGYYFYMNLNSVPLSCKIFSIHKDISGFLDVARAGHLNFFQIHEEDGILVFFKHKLRLYFHIFLNSLKRLEIGNPPDFTSC